jgi:biopolymer transport protein ExbD
MIYADKQGGSNLQSEINITPLVDVVLVLLIIFMVVVPLLLRGYDVDIARTSTDTVASQSEEAQVVLASNPRAARFLRRPKARGYPEIVA